jgi:HEAT repeat protein
VRNSILIALLFTANSCNIQRDESRLNGTWVSGNDATCKLIFKDGLFFAKTPDEKGVDQNVFEGTYVINKENFEMKILKSNIDRVKINDVTVWSIRHNGKQTSLLTPDNHEWISEQENTRINSLSSNKTISGYIADFHKSNVDVRESAIKGLVKIGKSAIPELITALKIKNWDVRLLVVTTLNSLSPKFSEVQSITDLLKDTDSDYRRTSIYSLGQISSISDDAIPFLNLGLKDDCTEVRKEAARSIGKIGAKANACVPNLIMALSDNEKDVRDCSAQALGDIGSNKNDVISNLERVLLEDKERVVVESAGIALGKIGSNSTNVLLKALNSKKFVIRISAVRGLALVKPTSDEILQRLSDCIKDDDVEVRYFATVTLSSLKKK